MSQISTVLRAKVGGGYAGRVFLGLSAVSALFSVYSYAQSFSAQKEIDFRKRQLARPVYKLSEDEHVNPPWNHDNLDDWLFRRGTIHMHVVEVVGRPIVRLTSRLPTRRFLSNGIEEIVPLVCREDKQHKHREGLLMSRGFVPLIYSHPTCRHRI